jgi:uncharacterized protein (TIGR03000 family)
MAPPAVMPAPAEGEKIPVPPTPKKTEEAAVPASATIVVTLPAEAKLLIDGNVTKSTSAYRVFASPTLEPGKQYAYTLVGELVRDGQKLTTTKEIQVSAGQETRVELEFSSVRVAQR